MTGTQWSFIKCLLRKRMPETYCRQQGLEGRYIQSLLFFKILFFIYVYECFPFVCVCVIGSCLPPPQSRQGIGYPRTRGPGRCEPSCVRCGRAASAMTTSRLPPYQALIPWWTKSLWWHGTPNIEIKNNVIHWVFYYFIPVNLKTEWINENCGYGSGGRVLVWQVCQPGFEPHHRR